MQTPEPEEIWTDEEFARKIASHERMQAEVTKKRSRLMRQLAEVEADQELLDGQQAQFDVQKQHVGLMRYIK